MKNTTNVVFRDSPETKNDIDDRVKKEKRNPSHPCFSRDSAPYGRAIPAPLRGALQSERESALKQAWH